MLFSIIFINILWIVYSLLEGFREGYYWYNRNNSPKKDNIEIHPYFAIQRGLVMVSLSIISYTQYNLIVSLVVLFSLMLIFSFFHNGIYYLTRNKLDNNIYKDKWKSQSTTSTAKLTKLMTYRNRLFMMIIGFILQISIIMLYHYSN